MSEGPALRVDGERVSPDRFYATACDPAKSVVVEACAGSGKTWMLVSRIVRLLLAGVEPHHILAITFTRAAAGEMRDRLAGWLAEWSMQASVEDRIRELRMRGVGPGDAVRLEPALRALHGRLLDSGRPVAVLTFHAWFVQLLRLAPLELLESLGLQPDMSLIEDDVDLRAPVFRAFHAAVLRDPALRADYGAMVAKRGRHILDQWLGRAWQRRIEIAQADAAGTLEESVEPASEWWGELAGVGDPANQTSSPAFVGECAALARHLARGGATPRKQGAKLERALELDDPRARLNALGLALYVANSSSAAAWPWTTRERVLGEVPGLVELRERLMRFRSQCAQHDACLEHGRMVRLSRALLAAHADHKRRHGVADMADLERLALAALRDGDLAGWMQEKLDLRVRHLLIDEFQDTSPLQWHALHAWLASYAGAGGGASGQQPPSLFIVGDPKQSLYRFRGAEPGVFEAAADFVVDAFGGHRLACDHTRRSAPRLVEAINRVFEAAAAEGEFAGFRAHSTAQPERPGDGVWRLPRVARPEKNREGKRPDSTQVWRDTLVTPRLVPDEVLREQEAARAADLLRQWLDAGDATTAETVLLARKRESLHLAAAALRTRAVPHGPVSEATLMDAAGAQDLVSLLDLLASPQHGLSLARVLKSPLMGASDADLVALAVANREPAGWWDALQSLAEPSPALARARTLLRGWADAAGELPPHDLLGRIVHEGDLHARTAAALPPGERQAGLDAIDAVLAQALLLDSGRYSTPYAFVRALRQRTVKAALPMPTGAVRLLTVHGAKGLEADTVLLLDADPEKPGTELCSLLIDWPVEAPGPLRCAFVYNEAQIPPSLQELYAREEAARRRESLNVLYVAMTRARRRLAFSATEAYAAASGTTWWQRLERAVPDELPLPEARTTTGDGTPASLPSAELRVLPTWRPAPVGRTDEASSPTTVGAEDPRAAALGRAVHRTLEWAARSAVATGLDALSLAAAREFGADPGQVRRHAAAILAHADTARFFRGAQIRWSGNEVPVSASGEVLRIDRLVQLAEEGAEPVWWVLDYKLRHAPEALEPYRQQLLRYRDAVREAQPGAAVRCAFIAGDGRVIEIVHDDAGGVTSEAIER